MRFSVVGETGEQVRRISVRGARTADGFPINRNGIGSRGLAGGLDPCGEDLFQALDVELRQQPAIEGPAGGQKQARAEQLTQKRLVFTTPLAHRLAAIPVTEQGSDQAGHQERQVIHSATHVCPGDQEALLASR